MGVRGRERARHPETHTHTATQPPPTRLEVPVGDAGGVEVGNTPDQLHHVAVHLLWLVHQLAGAYPGVQIAAGEELHHHAPPLPLILDQVDGLDHVFMLQGGGDAKLGDQLLDVLLLRLLLAAGAELLDGVLLRAVHRAAQADGGVGALAEDVGELAVLLGEAAVGGGGRASLPPLGGGGGDDAGEGGGGGARGRGPPNSPGTPLG
jgi:hypothetical protein